MHYVSEVIHTRSIQCHCIHAYTHIFAQASGEAEAAAVTHRLVEAVLDMASATFEAEYEVPQESPTGGVPQTS